MKIKVDDIQKTLEIKINGQEEWLQAIYKSLEQDELLQDHQIQGEIFIEPPAYQQVQVKGRIRFLPKLDCSRCNEKIAWPIDRSFEVTYRPHDEDTTDSAVDLSPDALADYFIDEKNRIDIEVFLNDLIQTEIPYKIISKAEDGKTCAVCGIDLEKPLIYETPISPENGPFGILSRLKTDKD